MLYLYVLKWTITKNIGICYVDVQTGLYDPLYSKYKYWHVGVSRDGKNLITDTQYNSYQSKVVIINRESGGEFVVDMPYMISQHTGHPYPQLSPNNRKVVYTAFDKENVLK